MDGYHVMDLDHRDLDFVETYPEVKIPRFEVRVSVQILQELDLEVITRRNSC